MLDINDPSGYEEKLQKPESSPTFNVVCNYSIQSCKYISNNMQISEQLLLAINIHQHMKNIGKKLQMGQI